MSALPASIVSDNAQTEEQEDQHVPVEHVLVGMTCLTDDDRIRAAGVAAVIASTYVWPFLGWAFITRHGRVGGMSRLAKAETRSTLLCDLLENESKCYGLLRMGRSSFQLLCEKFDNSGKLRVYRNTSTEEQVVTFLLIAGQKISNRALGFLLFRSGETVSRYFHNVLDTLLCLSSQLIDLPTAEYESEVVTRNRRFHPYFKDCIGAIDGTHVRVKVPKKDAPGYRGRKDCTTTNILACCRFDMSFTYVLAGWEGSASDSRVLKDALSRRHPLVIPPGRYYLGDSGFGLSSQVLVPFGNTRYHLKEYEVRGPENYKELFNHRHASLRNTIERTFGVLKKRFPIIGSGSECQYSCDTMRDLFVACCVLHNFLIKCCSGDNDRLQVTGEGSDGGTLLPDLSCSTSVNVGVNVLEFERGRQLREQIAQDMWRDYISSYSNDAPPQTTV